MTAALGAGLEVAATVVVHGTRAGYRRCPTKCQPCRAAHAAYRARQRAGLLTTPPPQPCGACDRLVLWRSGRIAGRQWWHAAPECRAERDRARSEWYHRRRRLRVAA